MRFFLCLLFLSVYNLYSQNDDEKLAAQYMSDKDYVKAADIYEDLSKKKPESVYYYENLLQCYILLSDYKNAEKLVDKRIKKFENQYNFRVDKAYLYQLQGFSSKRDEVLKELIEINFQYIDEVNQLANGLIKRKFIDQAIALYVKAEQSFKSESDFAYELSVLYFQTGKIQEGTEQLLSLAAANDALYNEVKNRIIVAYADKNENYKLLSNILLQKLQKQPDNYAYNEFLIWSFTQQKDWTGALIQAKAVDKRLKEEGRKVLELAYVFINNEAYDPAISAYEYVKSLGTDKRYYYQAQQGLLNCGMASVRMSNGANAETLKTLEAEYISFIYLNGINWQTAEQIKELAELYIYYLHQPEKGIAQLNKVMETPGVNPGLLAKCKLDLGDAQLIVGESWEADLLYKQVEKSFNNDPLGQEAKFRYARLCYFRGDFEWAQTQLDILKGATTQLISNNAMRLWLIIQDNLGLDSTDEALKMYADADLLIFQNKYNDALTKLNEIPVKFPGHSLSDEILFAKATIAEKRNQFDEAEKLYLEIIKNYSFDILADNAVFQLAQLYEFKLKDLEKAKKMYETIILNYTGSLYITEARKRFRNLRGDAVLEKEQ